jgi:IS5 family transposase
MLPDGERLIADKGYDSDVCAEALAARGSTPGIPPRSQALVARNIPARLCIDSATGREYVGKAKRLAACLNALRPLPPHILQRYLHRGARYLWLGQ